LTGGDRLQGRFMRADFFAFAPQFKLVIVGNHKPSLRGVDEAIRRRLHLVPFTVTIPSEERDPQLSEKLKAEWPVILAWMIEGCLEWQEKGLAPPARVVDATATYLAGEDSFEQWRDECAVPDVHVWEAALLSGPPGRRGGRRPRVRRQPEGVRHDARGARAQARAPARDQGARLPRA
jgi:putative DNA primase/helicase